MGFRNVIHEVASTPFYRDHPREALAFLAARSLLFRRRMDPRDFLLGLGIKDLDLLQRDFEHRAPVFSEVQTAAHKAGCGRPGICSDDGFILYCLIRWLRPAYVIETGVAAGILTTFLLAALADNQEGCRCLWSIEIPPAHVENHKIGRWKGICLASSWRGLGHSAGLDTYNGRTMAPRAPGHPRGASNLARQSFHGSKCFSMTTCTRRIICIGSWHRSGPISCPAECLCRTTSIRHG